jgi:MFS transporter, OFA family, oxalate/formate antiporter
VAAAARPFCATLRRVPTQNRSLPVVGGVMMNMAFGMLYGMSAFMLPLEKEFGWTRAQTSWATTIGLVMLAVWYVIAGRVHDVRGPRLVAAIGGVLFSLGLLLASFTQSIWMFYLTAGVIAGTGSGFGYVVPTSVGSKWFPDKRGLIVGLMVGGFGAGSGVFGPIATWLIARVGWRATFQIYSLLFFAMTMTATYLVRNPPAGYRPPGWDPSKAPAAARGGADVPASTMVRTATFWVLWVAYCLGTAAGTMVISQLVPFARSAGHSAAIAAFALTVGAIGSASGRVFSGWMSDHAGRLNTIRTMLVVQTLAMPALFLLRENPTLFLALLAVVYYCYGTQLSVYASTSADFYGTKNIGLNYGLLLLAWGVASIIGPFLGGRVFVATGEYRWAFYTAAAISVVALGVLAAAKNPHAQPVAVPARAARV